MRYLLLYCHYEPDTYSGHRIEQIEAETLSEAKEQAKAFLNKHWIHRVWEFRLVEIGAHDGGYRLWDTRPEPNKSENDYTVENYWSK